MGDGRSACSVVQVGEVPVDLGLEWLLANECANGVWGGDLGIAMQILCRQCFSPL